jgi:hypothetical protein
MIAIGDEIAYARVGKRCAIIGRLVLRGSTSLASTAK